MTEVTEKKSKDMDHAIECPKCHDFIILSSDFDRLCYICDECDFSLCLWQACLRIIKVQQTYADVHLVRYAEFGGLKR
ncbi:MAG: hypothetical protein WCF23_02250 [Candidatus Nitrosopolaris sp.]